MNKIIVQFYYTIADPTYNVNQKKLNDEVF